MHTQASGMVENDFEVLYGGSEISKKICVQSISHSAAHEVQKDQLCGQQ
jgi:hypothetical protein